MLKRIWLRLLLAMTIWLSLVAGGMWLDVI